MPGFKPLHIEVDVEVEVEVEVLCQPVSPTRVAYVSMSGRVRVSLCHQSGLPVWCTRAVCVSVCQCVS